jgi:hypothetical protein
VAPARSGLALPEGWQHGAFMEIFVRAWRDSDGDGIGDLRGLTKAWTTCRPGHPRPLADAHHQNADGDHGYATTDFRDIAPEYGTLADFDELIAQAHRRGIGVVMDYVINHAAATHPMFQSASAARASPFTTGSCGATPRRRLGHLGPVPLVPHGLQALAVPRRPEAAAAATAGRAGLLLRHLRAAHARLQLPPTRRWWPTTTTACASGSTAGSTATGSMPCRTCWRPTPSIGTTSRKAAC